MNQWINLAAVSICALAAGCGGGGNGGSRGPDNPPVTMTPMTPITPAPTSNPSAPQSTVDVQGLYFGTVTDPDDPDSSTFAQVLITADAKALIYLIDEEGSETTLAVVEGNVVASASDALLSQATAFIADADPVPITGRFQMNNDPNSEAALRVQLMLGDETTTIDLESLSQQYAKPSSLQAIAGNYGQGVETDATVMIDVAGNVIVTQDGTTGCSGTGRVTVDMPTVNAYALSLQLTGCIDPGQNGTYGGRLSVADLDDGSSLLSLFAHSNAFPLLEPVLEKI
jgi:hypothetical protein